MAKCDLTNCSWHPITHHFRAKKMVEVKGLVLHITDSKDTLESLRNGFDDPKQPPPPRSSHFAISKTGEIWQFVDTDDVAFAVDGIWGGDGIDNHWVSVENIAKYPDALTDEQVAAAGDLLFWLNKQHSVPFTLAESKGDRGLGYHRMFKKGDHICPGDNVIRQRAEILGRAKWGF